MHSVIRKRQGLPWAPEEPKGMGVNGSHLVGVQVTAGPPPVDDLGLAYSQRGHPKLVKQVVSADEALRRKALAHVCEQLRYARETASFLPAGIVPALNQSAEHKTDAETRTLATAALARLSLEGNGREHMLMAGPSASVPVLLRLVVDPEPAVRANALATVVRLGKDASCAPALIEGGAAALLVTRCTEEGEELLAAALAALEAIMMTSADALQTAIGKGTIGIIANLLSTGPPPAVCEHACYCLHALAVDGKEKLAAKDAGCCQHLIRLIEKYGASDDEANERVATAAAAALMIITIDNDCKAEAVRAGAVKALAPLLATALEVEVQEGLSPANSTLTANVMKCIANLAEHPLGRSQLKKAALSDLLPLADGGEEGVTKHAAIAVQKVTWEP